MISFCSSGSLNSYYGLTFNGSLIVKTSVDFYGDS